MLAAIIDEIIQARQKKNGYEIFFLDIDLFRRYTPYLSDTLSKDERTRRTTSRESLKDLFVIRRGILRCVLSTYLQCAPSDVRINRGENGKPYVDAENLFFNVSHTKNVFAVAVSKKFEVGVDVQYMREISNASLMANALYSKEEITAYTSLENCELQRKFFFQVWAAKEAVVKCIGSGLTIDLRDVDVLGKKVRRNGNVILMDFGLVQVGCVYAVAKIVRKENAI